jgi:hypothetical protein
MPFPAVSARRFVIGLVLKGLTQRSKRRKASCSDDSGCAQTRQKTAGVAHRSAAPSFGSTRAFSRSPFAKSSSNLASFSNLGSFSNLEPFSSLGFSAQVFSRRQHLHGGRG